MNNINLDAINREIEAGFINRQKHPTAELFIYNYTSRAQWEKRWTPETMMCRGLILDGSGNIVARPFPKFFNYEEVIDQIPALPFEVFDKLDGSLGILYRTDNGPAIATRGSFTSPQAKYATDLLYRKYGHIGLPFQFTMLFEIIYPENRIVVDYAGREDLVLLAVINTATGEEVPYGEIAHGDFPIVQRFDGMTDIAAIKAANRDNAEGFVLRFANGLRCKVKLAEYVRLHKLLTGITPRHIWEEMKAGRSIQGMLDRVPDEFYQWMNSIACDIVVRYNEIESEARSMFRSDFPTRKDAAAYITQTKYPSILFAMLDGKPYADAIWKLIRPEASRAFRCDEEMAVRA